MRALRLILRLIALALILILAACSSPAVSSTEPAMKQTSHAKTPPPGTPAIQPAKRAMRSMPRPSLIPERLVIPAIGIDALIEKVGVRSDGDVATPTRNPWDDAGWYGLGPRPGERGSSVIDGHLDRPGGYPAIFWRLRDIQVGNLIQVKNRSGQILDFRVARIASYTPEQAPLQDIFGNLGGTYLNLITCAGDWIPDQHQTTLRLVVYATLA
jgi:sortase (surface protein transpeptidase)